MLNETGLQIANALNVMAVSMAKGIDGEVGYDGAAQLIKAGLGAKAFPVGTQMNIAKETSVSATHTGEGITGITVDEEVFLAAEHESGNAAYEFTYDGAAWHKADGTVIELTNYGIAITGTPAENDIIVVRETASMIASTVLDHDYDTPVMDLAHTMTIAMNNCYENWQFDAPEALVATPDGLTNARYYIVGDHCTYGSVTTQDGSYGFTPSVTPELVRYVRHSTIGLYQGGGYTKAQILNGKFITYNAAFEQIEQCDTDEGETGTNLGTVTAKDPQYLVGDNVWYTERNAYGNNDWEMSNIRQYLNSAGTGWWRQMHKFDFPPANHTTLKGFLTGIDPALRANMIRVKKRYAKSIADGYGYGETEDKVFLLGMTEVNLGKNNNINETSYGVDGVEKTVPYAYYVGAANADRIKLLSASPRPWWLRGSHPSNAGNVRGVYTDGSLYYGSADGAYGLAAVCVIG